MKRKGHYYRLVMSRTGLSVDARGNGRCTPERLRQVWLFATAPLESLQALSKKFVTRTCFTDDVIYEKNADADAMYFLVTGQIEAVEFADGQSGKSEGVEGDGGEGDVGEGEGGGEGGGGDSQKKFGNRLVYMSGEDFGVEGLLDNLFSWSMTARVVSRKAVLLELSQEDMEASLEEDLVLNESAGEMLKSVKRLRHPDSLRLLWPFYGATDAMLEPVS